jgi:hypothetical protein
MAEKTTNIQWLKHKNHPLIWKLTCRNQKLKVLKHYSPCTKEAETQASVAIPVAAPQEPANETMTATQEPVISKSKSTMVDVLEENEFLKSQLEAYQQELAQGKGGI